MSALLTDNLHFGELSYTWLQAVLIPHFCDRMLIWCWSSPAKIFFFPSPAGLRPHLTVCWLWEPSHAPRLVYAWPRLVSVQAQFWGARTAVSLAGGSSDFHILAEELPQFITRKWSWNKQTWSWIPIGLEKKLGVLARPSSKLLLCSLPNFSVISSTFTYPPVILLVP
jgi:hypothetical protein